MVEIEKIRDVIARDTWESTGKDGKTIAYDIIVGRPFMIADDENQDWICPVYIQNYTDHIVQAYGVGPVDALMNAMVYVKSLFDKIFSK